MYAQVMLSMNEVIQFQLDDKDELNSLAIKYW